MKLEIGTISHGTLRDRDLLEAFSNAYKQYANMIKTTLLVFIWMPKCGPLCRERVRQSWSSAMGHH